MSPVMIWAALAIVFVLLGIARPLFLFICFVVGALVAALSAIATDSYMIQTVLFAIFSIAAVPISRPLADRWSRSKNAGR